MKKTFLFFALFIVSCSFSQSVNDYKAVTIPLKYDFQKNENEYRLNTLTKFNLNKAGFQAFYSGEQIPAELNDRCGFLFIDVKNEKAFLVTKLVVTFKDCNGKVIYQCEGKSKEKEYQTAYSGALNEAFKSIYALNYKYNGAPITTEKALAITMSTPVVVAPVAVIIPKNEINEPKLIENKNSNMLYAQPTSYGYQLIDSEPKVIMKVYKTSNKSCYMATKGSLQGVLISKDNQWFFEYYQNDTLISEKVEVKF